MISAKVSHLSHVWFLTGLLYVTFVDFQFPGHVDGIAFLDPKGDGRHLISNSKDQTIKLWDIRYDP